MVVPALQVNPKRKYIPPHICGYDSRENRSMLLGLHKF